MKIIWSDFSLSMMEKIAQDIEKQSFNAAQIVITAIFDRVKQLKKYPYSGKIEEGLQVLNLGHRFLVVYNFKIIYRVIDKNKIYITDVFSTSQNPKKIIYRSKETDSDW